MPETFAPTFCLRTASLLFFLSFSLLILFGCSENFSGRVLITPRVAVSTLSAKIAVTEASISDLSAKMTAQVQQQETSMRTQQAQAAANTRSNMKVFVELGNSVPGLCKLDCSNGGTPDQLCQKCIDCDDGFWGDHCHIPLSCNATCTTDDSCRCANAGILSVKNCECECAAGWKGALCRQRDPNSSQSDARRFLRRLGDRTRRDWLHRMIEEHRLNVSVRARAKRDGEQMIPNHLGNGVDPVLRQLRSPVIEPQLPATGAPRLWVSPLGATFALPDRVFFDVSPSTAPVMKDTMFNSVEDYAAFLQEERNRGINTQPMAVGSSLFVKSLGDMRTAFTHYEDSFIAITRSERHLYKLKLDITAQAPATTFQLEDAVSRAIDFLPPVYDETTKELYTMFFDYWGTSFVSAVSQGGVVESIHAVHSSTCSINGRASRNFLSDNQRQFMGKYVGLPGTWTVNTEYNEKCIQDASGCSGGNAAVCEEQLRNRASDDLWVQSLWALPAAISFETHAIHEVVRDSAKQQAMMAAAAEYERAKLEGVTAPIRTTDFCPEQPPGYNYPEVPPYWSEWRGGGGREIFMEQMLAY